MLRQRLNDTLKDAMKARDQRKVSTLRLVLAALKDKDINARTADSRDGISEDAIMQMLQTMVKQRRESIALYQQGGREDLVQQEQEEISVIEGFLPQQLSEAEVEHVAKVIIAEIGASGIKDMSKVVAALKQKYAGQFDPAKVAALIKALLGS